MSSEPLLQMMATLRLGALSWGTMFSDMVMLLAVASLLPQSDAARRLLDPGHHGGQLARTAGKELVQVLHAHPGIGRDAARSGRGPLLGGIRATECNDLPMRFRQRSQLLLQRNCLGDVAIPLGR